MKLEKMDDFFNSRVKIYDEHMLNETEGCREGYVRLAKYIPDNTTNILDLGCGTGLELEEIFRRFPNIHVTGIDLSSKMLSKLKEKYKKKKITLINQNYFDYSFPEEGFDCAISFQTMHHFTLDEKLKLYIKVYNSIKLSGVYIEADYMALNQEYEDSCFAEFNRLKTKHNIKDGFYHFDIPLTIEKQMAILEKAGFLKVTKVFQKGNTVMLVACK